MKHGQDTLSLHYTLLADGTSDRCLMPIIEWTVRQVLTGTKLNLGSQFADFRYLRQRPETLAHRIQQALNYFPCDILFVHRDAEGVSPDARRQEIAEAARTVSAQRHVPLVPVRMTEAWLLIDEASIRQASDNPNGSVDLALPPIQRLESIKDPKAKIRELLLMASEKGGRRQARLERDLPERVHRVASLIDDFSPLRQLEAFCEFEQSTKNAVKQYLAYHETLGRRE